MQLIIEHKCHASKPICENFVILGWSMKVSGWVETSKPPSSNPPYTTYYCTILI